MSILRRTALIGVPTLALVLFGTAVARALTPEAPQEAIAHVVGKTMELYHYGEAPIDDGLSERWFDKYLDMLDYNRVYFTQKDIDSFQQWRSTLDDDILSTPPSLQAAYAIHDRYVQRVEERAAYAKRILAKPPTFDDPSREIVFDRHDSAWAPNSKALNTYWQDRIAADLLSMELRGDERDKAIERLSKRYDRVLNDVREMDENDILELYMAAFTSSFDPHSVWFKPVTKENFDIEMTDSLIGIGAQLRSEDGYTTIEELIPGGPAELSGLLQAKDQILAVGQGGDEPVDIVDMRLDRVVQLIRGKKDTVVTLVVHPADAPDPAFTKTVQLTRDRVELAHNEAKGEIREFEGEGGPIKVGVIDIPSFYMDEEGRQLNPQDYGSTANDVQKILEDFNAKGVDSLVIDLRHNGGGRLDQAQDLTGMFLEGGPIVQIRDRSDRKEVLKDLSPGRLWSKPVVVLTSEMSASASEIFAAAIQDHQRGIVVGSKTTHGKGTVQQILPLDRPVALEAGPGAADLAGAMKFTTHMFYRVDGGSTQVKGVAADIVLPSPFEGLDVLESDLEYPLPWNKISPARYKPLAELPDVPALAANSRNRIAIDPEFSYLAEDIAFREEQNAKNTVSLHKATREKEIAEAEAIEAKREEERKARGWDGESDIDPVLDEAVHIARDWVQQER